MNNEFLGERRRALEEEYFAKFNRALVERLRAAGASRAKAGDAHGGEEVGDDASSDRLAREEC